MESFPLFKRSLKCLVLETAAGFSPRQLSSSPVISPGHSSAYTTVPCEIREPKSPAMSLWKWFCTVRTSRFKVLASSRILAPKGGPAFLLRSSCTRRPRHWRDSPWALVKPQLGSSSPEPEDPSSIRIITATEIPSNKYVPIKWKLGWSHL